MTEIERERVRAVVNGQPVALPEGQLAGLEIKQEAVSQGVDLQVGFHLSVGTADGYRFVDDDQITWIRPGQDFLAVSQDDHS